MMSGTMINATLTMIMMIMIPSAVPLTRTTTTTTPTATAQYACRHYHHHGRHCPAFTTTLSSSSSTSSSSSSWFLLSGTGSRRRRGTPMFPLVRGLSGVQTGCWSHHNNNYDDDDDVNNQHPGEQVDDPDVTTTTITPRDLNLLLIDHYDSFTYNLVDSLTQWCDGRVPTVWPGDATASAAAADPNDTPPPPLLLPTQAWDGIVLSPGPGCPTREDPWTALSRTLIRQSPHTPILGVCLGHQILGVVYGDGLEGDDDDDDDENEKTIRSIIQPAPTPVHGQVCRVQRVRRPRPEETNDDDDDDDDPLWRGLPLVIPVTRYHSLCVNLTTLSSRPSVPLQVTAIAVEDEYNNDNDEQQENESWFASNGGTAAVVAGKLHTGSKEPNGGTVVCMGLRHVSFPHYGVQFHPESIGSGAYGTRLLQNFVEICLQAKKNKQQQQQQQRERRPGLRHEQQQQQKQQQQQQSKPFGMPPQWSIATAVKMDQEKDHTSHSATVDPPFSLPSTRPRYQVYMTKVPRSSSSKQPLQPEDVMEWWRDEPYTYWLDSSDYYESNAAQEAPPRRNCAMSKVSILGYSNRRVEYWGHDKPWNKRGVYVYHDSRSTCDDAISIPSAPQIFDIDILTYLQEQHDGKDNKNGLWSTKRTHSVSWVEWNKDQHTNNAWNLPTLIEYTEAELQHLPFTFRGGHVGYLGYEVRHDTTARMMQQQKRRESPQRPDETHLVTTQHVNGAPSASDLTTTSDDQVPTAAFCWADRSLVFDHAKQEWYLVAVTDQNHNETDQEVFRWINETIDRLHYYEVAEQTSYVAKVPSQNPKTTLHNGYTIEQASFNGKKKESSVGSRFRPNRSKSTYNSNFEDCLKYIRQGESYELCLTNQLESTVVFEDDSPSSPFDLYRILRRRNPAPFSAFLNWNSQRTSAQGSAPFSSASLAVCCSSPERFISVQPTDGTANESSTGQLFVEAKPIKGTRSRILPKNGHAATDGERAQDSERAKELRVSKKDRAENLMIVDLLRNDLSRVCAPGSVHVAKLMDIETYATVHQMVSTIRGTLNLNQATAIDVLNACFPGGSMTGAPKLRTMELLNSLEEGVARGPYSGCLGYVSVNGCMDMNIVIRSAVVTPDTHCGGWNVKIGAGGAITILSDNDDEYEEMMLKASAVIGAVDEWAAQERSCFVKLFEGDVQRDEHCNGPACDAPINLSRGEPHHLPTS